MLTQLGLAHIGEDVFGHGVAGELVQIENRFNNIFARIERDDVCTYGGVVTCDLHAFDIPILSYRHFIKDRQQQTTQDYIPRLAIRGRLNRNIITIFFTF